MSNNFSLYLGGVIKITKTPQIEVPNIKNVCSNNKEHSVSKSNRRNENFCSICGSQIIQENYIENKDVNINEILGNHNGFFNYENNILSNTNKFGRYIDESDIIDEVLSFESNRYNLDKFKEHAKPLLEELINFGFEYEISNRMVSIFM